MLQCLFKVLFMLNDLERLASVKNQCLYIGADFFPSTFREGELERIIPAAIERRVTVPLRVFMISYKLNNLIKNLS